jgi:hypothetical protein
LLNLAKSTCAIPAKVAPVALILSLSKDEGDGP